MFDVRGEEDLGCASGLDNLKLDCLTASKFKVLAFGPKLVVSF